MATLRAAPTRHRHTEQFSGILTNQYLPGPLLKGKGRMGKTKAQNGMQTANSKLLQQHFAKNCKQATVYISHEAPLLEASGHPQYSGRCFIHDSYSVPRYRYTIRPVHYKNLYLGKLQESYMKYLPE